MGTKLGHVTRVSAVLVAAAIVTLTGGCGRDGEAQLESPVMVTLDNLDGQSIEISRNRPLVIPVGEDQDAALWTQGRADDTAVAEFVPGQRDGENGDVTEQGNLGFRAVGKGNTGAHLTNPETNETYTFTLIVD